jgi:hypothetical protein
VERRGERLTRSADDGAALIVGERLRDRDHLAEGALGGIDQRRGGSRELLTKDRAPDAPEDAIPSAPPSSEPVSESAVESAAGRREREREAEEEKERAFVQRLIVIEIE